MEYNLCSQTALYMYSVPVIAFDYVVYVFIYSFVLDINRSWDFVVGIIHPRILILMCVVETVNVLLNNVRV